MRQNTKGLTKGLKKDLYKPLEDKLLKKIRNFPDIAVKFLHSTKKKIRTQIEYAKDLTLFFEFLIDSGKCKKTNISLIDIDDINKLEVDDIEDFLDYLLEYDRSYVSSKGKTITQHFENSPVGIARKRATLSRFFGFLLKRDLIDKNIIKKLEEEDIPDTTGIKERLEPEELQKLFDVILEDQEIQSNRLMKFHQKLKKRDYIIVLLLAYTGIRVGELVQLDIDDIYLKRRYIHVLRKGGKRAEVTLPQRIIEDIEEYVEDRKQIEGISTNALFLSLRKKRISDKTIREMMKKYELRSGIEVHITPHLFRRTFGTNHYNNNHDMYLTAEVLGHDSAETTKKHYANPSKKRVVKSMDEFDYLTDDHSETSKPSLKGLKRVADKLGISIEELQKEMNG